MAIVNHPDWDLSERGKKDAERHQKKIDETIRKNVRDVIAEESIITQKRGKKVRVPVKGLKDYRFIHGKPKKGEGEGAGIAVIDRLKQKNGRLMIESGWLLGWAFNQQVDDGKSNIGDNLVFVKNAAYWLSGKKLPK